MKIRHVHNSFIPKVIKVEAITLYPFIFYRGEPSEILVKHELVHCAQIEYYGWLRFYVSYFMEYLSYRIRGDSASVAYHRISYEKEAYKLQEL